MARWMVRLDWRARLSWWPSQTPGLIEAAGLTRADVDAAAWAILPDGTQHQGAAAVAVALDQLWPGGVPVCATLVRLPGMRQVAARGYAWVAANRHRVPGTAACPVGQPPPPAPDAVLAEVWRRSAAKR